MTLKPLLWICFLVCFLVKKREASVDDLRKAGL